MPINPGKLDHRVAIQTGTESRDASGGVAIAWATTTTVWGSRLDQGVGGTSACRAILNWRELR